MTWQIHSWLWEINVFYVRRINRYQQIRVYILYISHQFSISGFSFHFIMLYSYVLPAFIPKAIFFHPLPPPPVSVLDILPPHAVSFLMYELGSCVIISVHVPPCPLLLSVFVSRILSWARAASTIGAAQINARVWINTCQKKKKKRQP